MSYEEAFMIIVGIDHPERNTVDVIRDNSTGLWLEDINPKHFDSDELFVGYFRVEIFDLDVRFTKDDEKIASSLKFFTHVKIRVHASAQNGNASDFAELRRESIVVESTCYQDIAVYICSFSCSGDKIMSSDSAKFGTNKDGSSFFFFTFEKCCFSTNGIYPPPPPLPAVTLKKLIRSSLLAC